MIVILEKLEIGGTATDVLHGFCNVCWGPSCAVAASVFRKSECLELNVEPSRVRRGRIRFGTGEKFALANVNRKKARKEPEDSVENLGFLVPCE